MDTTDETFDAPYLDREEETEQVTIDAWYLKELQDEIKKLKQMKTLYTRLTEANKIKLTEVCEEFPTMGRNLTTALTSNHSWSDLKVGDAQCLIVYLTDKVFSVDNLSNLFENDN